MTITIAQPHLVRVLSTAAATIATKSTVPALSGLLIQARDGMFSAVGSDLYSTTRATCPCVDTLHPIVAPGDILDRVKALPPGDVRITVDGPALVVSSGKRRFKLAWMSADDFPKVHAEPAGGDEINAKDLATAISRVSVAMSYDSTRSNVYGLLFAGDELRATDGHRIAIVPSPTALRCRISAESAASLVKFCDGAEEIRAELKGTRLHVTRDDATMSAATLDVESFAPVRNILPVAPSEHTATIDTKALTASLRAIQSSTPKESRALTMEFADGAVHIRALGGERGEGEDVVPCEVAASFKFKCDVAYITQALAATDAAEASISFWDDWKPLVVKGSTTIHAVAGMN